MDSTVRRDKLMGGSRTGGVGDVGRWAALDLAQVPFEATLSLAPLLRFWRGVAEHEEAGLRPILKRIEKTLARYPELGGPIKDPAFLDEHASFLNLLMTPIFPLAFRDADLGATLLPFEFRTFYATPSFEWLMTQENGLISGRVNLDARTFTYARLLTAYLHVLRTVYGIEVPFEYPIIFISQDPETDLNRHFRIAYDHRFLEIVEHGALPPLTDDTRRALFANVFDLEVWRKHLPPEHFSFEGFTIIRAHDVTEQQVTSALERDLEEAESLRSAATLPLLANRLKTLLRRPRLHLSVLGLDDDRLYRLHDGATYDDGLFSRTDQYDLAEIEGSLFDRCLKTRVVQVIEDLTAHAPRTDVEDELLRAGVRNAVAAPLYARGRAVGVLYLWTDTPGHLHALHAMKLLEVLPLFATAVARSKEEERNRVQSVMLGEYASFHPTVEWRFKKAAVNYLRRQEQGERPEGEPIVFQDVYPLFAATDIRSSSTHRNDAIQCDLIEHLGLVQEILREAREARSLPLLHHLTARTTRYAAALKRGLSSGDEAAVRDFLQRDFDPILDHLRPLAPEVTKLIDAYREAMDPERGYLYRQCRDFELSVARINRTIADYLDAEQKKVQQRFPHYFERHQTDGVDFTLYVGPSLLENPDRYDTLSVKALRLWQLMVMCGVAARVAPLKEHLEVPLDMTHLILVQDAPISIRYRFDEAQFDVDGVPHIRYEIMKQRVEKACIKGTEERVVQPGKIAIVYSHQREAVEYEAYVADLQEQGLLEDEVERLDLADLQGMKGLKTIRVAVAQTQATRTLQIDPDTLADAAEQLKTN